MIDWFRTERNRAALLERVESDAPWFLLLAAIAIWCALFGVHVTWRHEWFGTFDHDLGIWDQAIWKLAHGKSFVTVRGLDVFGFHLSPALYLYAPFYWLGAGPEFLNLTMIFALGLGAIPVYRIAEHYLKNEWYSLVVALAFLVNYGAQWMLHETFHPEVVAITPLLFAYEASLHGRWKIMAIWLAFALMWKEDVALVGAMLGLLLMFRGWAGSRSPVARQRPAAAWFVAAGAVLVAVIAKGIFPHSSNSILLGAIVAAVLIIRGTRVKDGPAGQLHATVVGLYVFIGCVLWFVVATRLVIPGFNDGGNFTDELLGDLGSSPREIVTTAIVDPMRVAEHLDRSEPHRYLTELSAAYGLVPLSAPFLFVLALPQLLINLLGQYNFFWSTRLHYAALPIYATTLAAIEGVASWRRLAMRRFLVGLIAVGSFYTGVVWGLTPASPKYEQGFWSLDPSPQQADFENAVGLPRRGDAVSAMYLLVPHLTHRDEIYTFPNPWLANNWAIHGENRPPPDTVDWLILNPSTLDTVDFGVLLRVLEDPEVMLERDDLPVGVRAHDVTDSVNRAKWRIVVDKLDLLVLQRRRRS